MMFYELVHLCTSPDCGQSPLPTESWRGIFSKLRKLVMFWRLAAKTLKRTADLDSAKMTF
jgi:hypothetical protein